MGYCQGSAFIVGLLLMQVGGLGPAHPGSVCPQEVDKRRVFPPSGVLLGQNLPLCPPVTSDSLPARPPGGEHRRLATCSVPYPFLRLEGGVRRPTQSPPRVGWDIQA